MNAKFEVPYNGDDRLVEIYLQHKSRIVMVYGRAEDGYPQGRKTSGLPPITLSQLFNHAIRLRTEGIEFNYLLNGNCFGNREYEINYRRRFVSFVKNLVNHGIRIITIGNIYLMEVISNEVPEANIFASVLLEIDCLSRLKEIEKLGIKYVCLSKTLLKNFEALNNIAKYHNNMVCPVLLTNDPCLHYCPYTHYHNNTLSHLTGDGVSCVSYCRLHCTKIFLTDPSKIVSASFIRPEDIQLYNQMGYSLFKLCDRKQTTDWIFNVLQAYMNGYYDGNLAEIMAPWNKRSGFYPKPQKLTMENFVTNKINVLRDNLRFTPNIDNRKLDGYLQYWFKHKPGGCGDCDCGVCGYCTRLAKKAVAVDLSNEVIIAENLNTALKYVASA